MNVIRRSELTALEDRRGRQLVIVAVDPGETLPLSVGQETEDLIDDAFVRVLDIRLTDAPEPGLNRDERVYVLTVQPVRELEYESEP